MFSGLVRLSSVAVLLFAAAPTSSNYALPSYDFGTGGVDNASSSNFRLNATTGTQSGDVQSSASYTLGSGQKPTQNSDVPPAPTLSNPSSYYDRLLLVVNPGPNPTDTTYLVAISSDGFATTRYVQSDNSIGSTYSRATFRTYASYGAASGFLILGLTPNTTYQVKVKAIQGNFTESAFSPVSSSVATSVQTLSFGLTTTLTSTPPFTATFTSLAAGSVFTANADINISYGTNALIGGTVYIAGQNTGLMSASTGYTIASATADLSSTSSGYGAQVVSASQVSGGPNTASAPYNGSSDNVGILTTSLQNILATSGPVTSATATLRLKARVDSTTPTASDYTDQLSIVAAMNY